MAPAGTWTWIVFPSKAVGAIPSRTAFDRTYDSAACALSRMTSPSIPVSTRCSVLACHHGGLDEKHISSGRGPRQTRRHPGLAGPFGDLVEEPRPPQILLQGADAYLSRHPPRPSTNRRASLRATAPISRSRLRTPASRVYSRGSSAAAPRRRRPAPPRQPMRDSGLRDQVLLRDPHLLVVRVSAEREHLQPIPQWRWESSPRCSPWR